MDYTRLLNALPQAKAAYGNGSSNGPTSVGSWNVTPVTKFEPETTNFQAGFYKDTQTGQYRVGFAGSNDSQDWTRANANLATGNWTPEATDSIRFVGAALVQIRDEILATSTLPDPDVSLATLISKLDTTVGHSQGGAWAELNRAFWGGNAVNIDGPGVGGLLNKPEFAALKAEMQKEFPDLASEAFTANDGSMQSYAFSKIGLTGDHVGSTVQATTDAKVVDFLTDFPVPPLMGQQATIGSLHTALTHRIDAIENQAKEGAKAEMNSQIEDAFNNADQNAADIKAKYPNTEQVADASGDLPNVQTSTPDTGLTLQGAAAGIGLFNAISNIQNWDQLSDLGKLSALAGLHNALAGVGTDLPGDFGGAASWLSFAQGIESGNVTMTVAGLNSVSDQAIDGAINSALGSSGVPYVSAVLAISNFENNPAQSMGTLVGMYFAGPLGGAIGGFVGGALGGLFGDDDLPPPPGGVVHFSWDASGHIQHTVDFNQSGGGDAANQVAASVQAMLQSVVDAHNAQNPSSADDIAINPYLLPRFGYSGSSAWMEVSLPDGSTVREGLNQEGFAQRLLEVLQDNGGIAPAWQVQTQQMHYQQALQEGQSQAQAEAPLRLGIGGQAVAGDEAFSLQGNAAESADFKSQTFGALVVRLGDDPKAQAAQMQVNTVLRDVEGDGYFEQTQTVAAKDSAGNLQAVLTIDFNGDGLIQTRDILNLGGNTAQGNPTDEARLANDNADQQLNNIQWLDANGDAVLDKSDPAFAAIKLWVDVNQDGSQQSNEAASLSSQNISSINFKTGEVTYEDGHTDALTAQTLMADTEGVKLTQIQEVNPDGTLHTLDAGEVLEHEGYQGKVQITDEGGTRWASAREQTYEQQALRTGDWEGTAEQEAHRHGGGNVDGTPTQTTATCVTDLGPVKTQADVVTQSTLEEGDARVVSDAPTQAQIAQANAQTTVGAGDSRIKSNAAPATTTNTVNTNPRPADTRIVFVPTTQSDSVQNQIQAVTNRMIESAQNIMFSASSNAGLGVLPAFSAGATQSAQAAQVEAERRPAVLSNAPSAEAAQVPSVQHTISNTNSFSSTPNASLKTLPIADVNTPHIIFKQADLGVFTVQPVAQTNPSATPSAEPTLVTNLVPANPATSPSPNAGVQVTVMVNANTLTQSVTVNSSTPTTSEPQLAAQSALVLDYPVVQGETLAGVEDVVLRLTQAVLLANDSTPTASADPNAPALTITAVSAPVHGQVSLVNGEVVFMPEENFHGEASFTYTVTDQYGLSTTGIATLNIAAVNDAPVTQGEATTSDEDIGLIFTPAQLLANDSDADVATDGQVLSISRVGQAEHGTVWLDAQGNLRFVPDANYNGPAQFTYWVSDSVGVETPATASLTVLAVNDLPVAVGETISENEGTTLLISQAALLQNDSDVDVVTNGQLLSITAVNNAQHGMVTLNADGTISFVPEADFYGNASFDYTVDDGNGGQVTTTATIALANVDDAPVATGETVNSREDEVLTINASALLQNDSDIDNAHADLAISRVQSGTGGTVSLNANGNVVFTPTANYNGTATFTYWVKDPDGLESNAVTTTVVLAAVNDAPSAQGETVTGASEDAVFNINKSTLLANDHDIDNADNELSLSWVGNATGGTVSLDASGNVVFTPTANFNGNATFQYKVRDKDGLESAVVQAVIPVAAVNDVPVAVDDRFSTYVNTTMTIAFNQLTGNDTDVDHDALTVSAVRDHANGHASIVNGQVQFVANAGFTGSASFDYLANDGHGGQTWATAFVDVRQPPNQYATVNWTSSSGWGYDYVNQWVQTGFSISDDSDPSAVQISLISASSRSTTMVGFFKFETQWIDASGGFTISRSGNGGNFRFDGNFDLIETSWRVVDDRGLENIWHWNVTSWSDARTYSITSFNDHYGYYYPPIILDLNGDGTHYTSLVDSRVAFDVNFDGLTDRMAWAGNDDGVLVWDKDHNHQITDASEFGFQTLKAGAQTDLEGLQALDTNGNGLLDEADDKFAEFAVWQDANGNGVTDEGEFKTLTQLGIASINLHSNGQVHNAGAALANSGSGETDVTVMGTTVFTRTDGSTGHADDAMLAYEDGSVKQAEINRQTLLFNQMCNTAIVHDAQPLGVIPIEPDVSLHDWMALSTAAASNASLSSNTLLNT